MLAMIAACGGDVALLDIGNRAAALSIAEGNRAYEVEGRAAFNSLSFSVTSSGY